MHKFVYSISAVLLAVILTFPSADYTEVQASQTEAIHITAEENCVFEADCPQAEIVRNYEIVEAEGATEGRCLSVKADAGFQPSVSKNSAAEVLYPLEVEKTGYYFMWQRAFADNTGTDSAFFAFDDDVPSIKEYMQYGEWVWYLAGIVYLTEGRHTLKLLHREMYLKLDQFLFTSIPDYVPDGERLSKPEFLPESEQQTNLTYSLPPIVPPSCEHPRVFLRKKDIPGIQKNLEHSQNKEVYELVKEYSQLETDGTFSMITPDKTTNVELNVLACIEANAFLYLMDGDVQKGEKAVKLAKNAISSMINKASGDDITRSGGHCIFVVSLVYDWCYPLMSDEERDFLRSYIYTHASFMEVGWPAVNQGNVTGHATEGQLWKDLLTAGIAMYDEDPKMYNLVAGRLFSQLIPVKNYTYQSMCFTEGALYGPYRFGYEMICAYLFKGMGYENIFSKNQQYALYSIFYARRPDGRFISTGDDSDEDLTGFKTGYCEGFFLAGNYYKDPYLKREYYRCKPYGKTQSTAIAGAGAVLHLITNDVTVEADQSFRDLPLTMFSDDPSGIMFARTGWEEGMNSKSMLVQMNIQQKFFSSHQHLDSGHFDIFYKGTLAPDSGIYESAPFQENGKNVSALNYGSSHDLNYHKRSIAHNTMLVYDSNESTYHRDVEKPDGGQKGYYEQSFVYTYEDMFSEQAEAGEVLSYDWGSDRKQPAYSYLKGDLTGSYSEKVEHFTRSFLFLNLFDNDYPGAMIVFDNVTSSDKDFKKTWLLHSQEEPEVNGNVTTIKRTEFGYDGRLVNETLLPEKPAIEKIGGEGKEFWVNGKNYTAVPKTPTTESGKWRIEVSPSTAEKQNYFLNVLQVSDNDDSIVPLKSEIVKDDEAFLGVKVKDRVALLKKDDVLTSKNISVDLPQSEEELMYIVTGMKSGKWNIYQDGKLIDSQYAFPGHDTFSFQGKAGSYQMKWEYTPQLPQVDLSIPANTKPSETLPVDVKIDTMFETFENEPLVRNDILCLPLEEFLKKSEIPYEKDGDSWNITGKAKASVTEGSNLLKKGDETVELEEALFRWNGVVYAPIPRLIEQLKYEMQWDTRRRIAFLRLGTKSLDRMQIVNSDDPERIRIYDVDWSSGSNEVGYVSVDNNLLSYWAALGDNEWISYTFEEPSSISRAELKWHIGDQRVQAFDIEVSEDGEQWTKVYSGKSSGKTDGFETVDLKITEPCRYLKIVGHCNSANNWNSLAELRLYR